MTTPAPRFLLSGTPHSCAALPRDTMNEFPRMLRLPPYAFSTEGHVAVQPGIGFASHVDEYVRFALIENQHRTRQAIRGIKKVISG